MHSRGHIHRGVTLGQRAADMATAFAGSWAFLGVHALWFAVWIGLRIEPFPFGLLTMIVSLEAIFLSTLVMMSQNRHAQRDARRDDVEATEVHDLTQMNRRQLEILEILHELQAEHRGAKAEVKDGI